MARSGTVTAVSGAGDQRQADVQVSFCATLVDEWVAAGVRDAVVCPGSRSTPMALALAERAAGGELRVHVAHDERAGAFIALGLGVSGTPALLLCTSGTAAANFHPAVVEAGLSQIPMLVLTADRPPELHGVGAAQTIDQQRLYGTSVVRFADAGVPDAAERHTWRALARVLAEFAGRGPVHLNLPFREPLVGTVDPALIPPRDVDRMASAPPAGDILTDDAVAGNPPGGDAAAGEVAVSGAEVGARAADAGWPGDAQLAATPAATAPEGAAVGAAQLAATPGAAVPGGVAAGVATPSGAATVDAPASRGPLEAMSADGIQGVISANGSGDGAASAGGGVDLVALLAAGRGLIVAGGRSGVPRRDVAALAERRGWPLLADPLSSCRSLPDAVTAFDALLRTARFGDRHQPDVVVRVGRPPASRLLSEFVVASGAPVLQVGGPGVIDPDGNVVARFDSLAALLAAAPADTLVDGWARGWQLANRAAEAAITAELGAGAQLSEPAVARLVALHRGNAQVVVAASMPMRDYEWFGGPQARGFANRGANGIDGLIATAIGIALGGHRVILVIGDVAFVHDSPALVGIRRRGLDLHIVVVDNDGGGIFSFLPQAQRVERERFEALYGTPHGTDVVSLALAHGIDATTVDGVPAFVARLGRRGLLLTRVASTRTGNVEVHRRLHAAVSAAIDVV